MPRDKIIVVTGGLSGLGAATVEKIVSLGAFVAVIDLQLPKIQDNESVNPKVKHFKADVSNTDDVKDATSSIILWSQTSGRDIAAVICCAGFLGPAKIISKKAKPLDMDKFQKVVNISLNGTLDVLRNLLPHMSAQEPDADGSRGVVITVSSAAAFDGQEGQVSYSAAKGAIAAMTLPLARDLSAWGIRAVCIAPGMFGTAMVAGMPDKAYESLKRSLEFPDRAGKPEEFASLVAHVIENKMLNGTVLRLDGGARMPSRL
ncbi:hypothetical protein H9Q72_010677 [Fusarium xylarioides]|uniref:3-hydroxyacyl-CoA dehydrogenase type-2 n=1 Tax=Fusarium xylarioides TaxID=221167 RepID=A0A9P7HKK4_9HYPO|nr:hypothetical protein H9Q70_010602 [Fusarium xylarioides]KAG5761201.1 hypothetical protein H9Q72_010677 [Fusarium xylarioides]KAG5776770.1 hypothetical protein H9Q73_009568 [Fusarium xylarioides]